MTGFGAAEDPVEAVKWWRKAAEQGDVSAQYDLGGCLMNGRGGVGKDLVEAAMWLQKAADQGHVRAKHRLDVVADIKAAERGDADAQYELGWCFMDGEHVWEDPAEAMKWYRKAAEQGHADAQFSLGECFMNGDIGDV